jgi:hypothetical protein
MTFFFSSISSLFFWFFIFVLIHFIKFLFVFNLVLQLKFDIYNFFLSFWSLFFWFLIFFLSLFVNVLLVFNFILQSKFILFYFFLIWPLFFWFVFSFVIVIFYFQFNHSIEHSLLPSNLFFISIFTPILFITIFCFRFLCVIVFFF